MSPSDDKTILADNYTRKVGNQKLYFRKYPQRGLAAHIVGYSTQVRSRAGLEESENDFLTGSNTNLSTVVDTTLSKLKGETIKGNDLHLTIQPKAQRVALNALGGKCGAAVALDTKTGAMLVSVSSPTYDPNLVESHFKLAARPRFGCAPLFNRAESGLYIPGSAFKVVTASAALDSGKFNVNSTFYDPGYCTEYGKQVLNFAVYCNIGKAIGPQAILNHAKRFGFYSVPPLETPVNERSISGLYDKGRLFFPKNDFQVDPGRLAFGQERMQVTPLQMAMIAATIGNGGVVLRPHVVEKVTAPDGSTVIRTKPDPLGRAVAAQHASEINQMMQAVVTGGTGTAAQIPGIAVAGKTGTAETGENHVNTTWFIAFAPADNPRIAVAVVVERQHATGGEVAAPIARQIMEALLR